MSGISVLFSRKNSFFSTFESKNSAHDDRSLIRDTRHSRWRTIFKLVAMVFLGVCLSQMYLLHAQISRLRAAPSHDVFQVLNASWETTLDNPEYKQKLMQEFRNQSLPTDILEHTESPKISPRKLAIPPIVWISWPSEKVSFSAKQNLCLNNWLHCSHGLKVRFITDNLGRKLIAARYPWLIETYDSYPFEIQRVDISRLAFLHAYGGIYADIDVCLNCALLNNTKHRDLLSLRTERKLILPRTWPSGFSNDFMLAPPGHPLVLHLLSRASQDSSSSYILPYFDVMLRTGPLFLSSVALSWTDQSQIRVLHPNEYSRGNSSFVVHTIGSSWHSWDAFIVKMLYSNSLLWVACLTAVVVCLRHRKLMEFFWVFMPRIRRHREKSDSSKGLLPVRSSPTTKSMPRQYTTWTHFLRCKNSSLAFKEETEVKELKQV